MLESLDNGLVLLEGPGWDTGTGLTRAGDLRSGETARDLAYILYISGSTGNPKGVAHTHQGALHFVEWCSVTFVLSEWDRFASHAPFYFDLSILDLFVCVKHGATLVLIDDDLGKNPLRLAPFIASERISVWYSTPTVLRLLMQYGKMERYDIPRFAMCCLPGRSFLSMYSGH